MARIELGGYAVESYSHGWEVYRRSDTSRKREPGYYSTLSAALAGVLERRLRDSTAATVQELRAELAATRAELGGLMLARG
jgi:hypothetical protein